MHKLGWWGAVKHTWVSFLFWGGFLVLGLWISLKNSEVLIAVILTVGAAAFSLGGLSWEKNYIRCSCGKVITNIWADSCRHCGEKVPEELRKKK